MCNPAYVLAYLFQIRGRVKELEEDLRDDVLLAEKVKEKKRDWIGIYSNLVEELEIKYLILTNRVN